MTMNKNSEMALQTVKSVFDKAVDKGGIFKSTDEVVDSINAYNYLVKTCTEIDRLAKENAEMHSSNSVPQNNNNSNAIPNQT